jgi:hypothetical protein
VARWHSQTCRARIDPDGRQFPELILIAGYHSAQLRDFRGQPLVISRLAPIGDVGGVQSGGSEESMQCGLL